MWLSGSEFGKEKCDSGHQKARDENSGVDRDGVGHLPCPRYFFERLKLPRLRRPLPWLVRFLTGVGALAPVSERLAISVGVGGRQIQQVVSDLSDPQVDVSLS